jgi:hypothetical protein
LPIDSCTFEALLRGRRYDHWEKLVRDYGMSVAGIVSQEKKIQ